jgi:hypothetical protein
MNKEDLATEAFDIINRKYDEHDTKHPKDTWTRRQKDIVEEYVNKEIDDFIKKNDELEKNDEITKNFLHLLTFQTPILL